MGEEKYTDITLMGKKYGLNKVIGALRIQRKLRIIGKPNECVYEGYIKKQDEIKEEDKKQKQYYY